MTSEEMMSGERTIHIIIYTHILSYHYIFTIHFCLQTCFLILFVRLDIHRLAIRLFGLHILLIPFSPIFFHLQIEPQGSFTYKQLLHRSSSILLFDNNFEILLIVIHTSVNEKLRKHAKVQKERSQTTKQPTQVNQDVSAVDFTGFTRSAFLAMFTMVADRVESENAEDICQVSNTGEEEEQGIKALSALATVVEQELRNAAAEVKGSAQVAEHLADNVEVQVIVLLLFGLIAVGRGTQIVSSDTGCNDKNNASQIEHQFLHDGALCRARSLYFGGWMHGVGGGHVDTFVHEALAERGG
jgi:hypothetical protein